jgi:hypothetical protein
MKTREQVQADLAAAQAASLLELQANPQAATGKCVISSAGWSECKDNLTEEQCDRQGGPGVTVTWTKGEKCP